jgi:hypothetical protein
MNFAWLTSKGILMARLYFLLLIFQISSAQTYNWSVLNPQPAYGRGTHLICDKHGNVIVCGSYTNYRGPHGSFLAKYNEDGELQWEKDFESVIGMSLSYDGSNDLIYLAYSGAGGNFIEKIDASESSLEKILLLPFVDGVYANRILSMTVDHDGNYIISGTYRKNFKIGQFSFPDPPAEESRFFVAKLNANDSCLWVISSLDGSVKYYLTMSTDQKNNILIGGDYYTSLSMNGFTIMANSAGFICKIAPNGVVQWLENVGDFVAGVACDKDNNIYTTGSFDKQFETCESTLYNNSALPNVFISKYYSNGHCSWVKKVDGKEGSRPGDITVNPSDGSVFVTGSYDSFFSLDQFTLDWGVPDIFGACFDMDGKTIWAINAGVNGGGRASGYDICLNDKGAVFITGELHGKALFGDKPQTSDGLVPFVASFHSPVTGLKKFTDKELATCFPNPSTGKIRIQMPGITDRFSFEVYNSNCQMLQNDLKVYNGNTELDLSGYPDGIYFIRCTIDNRSVTFKQVLSSSR